VPSWERRSLAAMGEIVDGLDRERIAALRSAGRFFWVDLRVPEVTRTDLRDVLSVPDHVLAPLLDFGPEVPPSRKFHAGDKHVVFTFTAFDEEDAIEVHVLVCGGYALTIHGASRSLPDLLDLQFPEGRSEQYLIYSVLDAMVITAFDRLNAAGNKLEELQAQGMNRSTGQGLRQVTATLSRLRRRIAPQRGTFERVSEEIGEVEGLEADSDRYFTRIADQLSRLVDGIDAASNAAANLVDLRLNETTYRLTLVATVFLPLTFLTGFFGMNFAWLIRRIDTFWTFALLGVGGCVVATVLTLLVLRRTGDPAG
jgi:magnesium transporter